MPSRIAINSQHIIFQKIFLMSDVWDLKFVVGKEFKFQIIYLDCFFYLEKIIYHNKMKTST